MQRSYRRITSAVMGLALVGLILAPGAKASPPEIRPKHAHGVRGQAKPNRNGGGNGISYHNGRILGTTKVVEIFYGGQWTTPAKTLVHDFDTSLGGSAYYNINTTYTGLNGARVVNAVNVVGSIDDAGSQGLALSDAGVRAVVAHAISTSGITNDSSTVWMVLGSRDVNLTSGYGTQYCGWHTYSTFNNVNNGYLATIDAARAPSACEEQTTVSPNGNPGIDGMLSVVAHEIEETATDVNLNAWYDSRGYENADKCAWTFGTTSTATNGSKYNVTLGTKNYLIQRNWVNASGGYCSMSY
ncbi:MAG: hypothetical protein QOG03_1721 [Actinomycetota bacterium]|jgi:hypothetical protein|nr:hypothetical protein [Actinomycetota bacterium]